MVTVVKAPAVSRRRLSSRPKTVLRENSRHPENAYRVFCAEGSGPDPYGNLVDYTYDASVEDNPFRFSTKFWNAEIGLYDYGYRHYSPPLARWLNRDPSLVRGVGLASTQPRRERKVGGREEYTFVRNTPALLVDPRGLHPISPGMVLEAELGGDIIVGSQFSDAERRTGAKAQCLVAKLLGRADQYYVPWDVTYKATIENGFGATIEMDVPSRSERHGHVFIDAAVPADECRFGAMVNFATVLMHEAYHFYDMDAAENEVRAAIDDPISEAMYKAVVQEQFGICGDCCVTTLLIERFACDCGIDVCACQLRK